MQPTLPVGMINVTKSATLPFADKVILETKKIRAVYMAPRFSQTLKVFSQDNFEIPIYNWWMENSPPPPSSFRRKTSLSLKSLIERGLFT